MTPSLIFLLRLLYNYQWTVLYQSSIIMRTYSSKIFAIINTTTTVVAVISIHTSAHQKMIDDDATSGSSICEGCMQYDTRKRDIP